MKDTSNVRQVFGPTVSTKPECIDRVNAPAFAQGTWKNMAEVDAGAKTIHGAGRNKINTNMNQPTDQRLRPIHDLLISL
jgi:hypothetical protein